MDKIVIEAKINQNHMIDNIHIIHIHNNENIINNYNGDKNIKCRAHCSDNMAIFLLVSVICFNIFEKDDIYSPYINGTC